MLTLRFTMATALAFGLSMAGCAGDEPDTQDLESAPGAAAAVDCNPSTWTNPGKVPNPKVTPVPEGAGKGKPFDQLAGMEPYDYQIKEFTFSGTAPDYNTRMVVRTPKDPAKFSGTVFVEWYNVSGGIDFAVLWAADREYFMREGHTYVAVSAQQVGVNGIKGQDAVRYGALKHPGDASANTIFSQAGAAVRLQTQALLGANFPIKALLAIGQSQSSFRLASYVNDTQKKDQVYDGFLLHSGLEPATNDPGVPTFAVFTTSEGNNKLTDGPSYVKWVVAGASHNDARIMERGLEIASSTGISGIGDQCVNPLNQLPSYRVYNAALEGLEQWVRAGKRPPAGKPLDVANNKTVLDEHGNAKGGIRLPEIEAPTATYSLNNGPKNPFDIIGYLACGLGGNTVPFKADKLSQLYPTHDEYVAKYTAAADAALAAGYLLKTDYDEGIAAAKAAKVPN